jgi:hypothetical protein
MSLDSDSDTSMKEELNGDEDKEEQKNEETKDNSDINNEKEKI